MIVAAVALVTGIALWGWSKTFEKAWGAETNIMIVKDGDRDSLAGVAGQLGGVAALLGGAAGGRDINEALAALRSRKLALEFLMHDKRIDAIQSLLHDGNPKPPGDPTDLQIAAINYFQKHVLSVDNDMRTGLITVGVVWRDRQVAADWANAYVAEANELIRRRTMTEAAERIAYLRAAAEKAETVDLRNAISSLLESQIRTQMLASTRPEFAFRVFDPAVRARVEERVRPKSALLGLIGTIIGGALASGVLLLLRRRRAPV
jgi:uncharacterized protein involved in exopolysaccharide biosynthesis